MTIVKGNIGNALHSVAPDHIVATADEIFDETLGQYQNEINQSAGAFDISEYNKSGDTPATYATLALALAGVPAAQQKGGVTVKYIDSTTSKYVQYRLTATAWSTTEADWQGVDDDPVENSENLVTSGGAYNVAKTKNTSTYLHNFCYIDSTWTSYQGSSVFSDKQCAFTTSGSLANLNKTFQITGSYKSVYFHGIIDTNGSTSTQHIQCLVLLKGNTNPLVHELTVRNTEGNVYTYYDKLTYNRNITQITIRFRVDESGVSVIFKNAMAVLLDNAEDIEAGDFFNGYKNYYADDAKHSKTADIANDVLSTASAIQSKADASNLPVNLVEGADFSASNLWTFPTVTQYEILNGVFTAKKTSNANGVLYQNTTFTEKEGDFIYCSLKLKSIYSLAADTYLEVVAYYADNSYNTLYAHSSIGTDADGFYLLETARAITKKVTQIIYRVRLKNLNTYTEINVAVKEPFVAVVSAEEYNSIYKGNCIYYFKNSTLYAKNALVALIAKNVDYDKLMERITPLAGKRMLTLGDSITFGKKWQHQLAALSGMLFLEDAVFTEYAETTTIKITHLDGEEQSVTALNYPVGYGVSDGIQNVATAIGGSSVRAVAVVGSDNNEVDGNSATVDGVNYNVGVAPGESLYERSKFIHNYSPDVIIVMGGQNDGTLAAGSSRLGSMEDAAYQEGYILQSEYDLLTTENKRKYSFYAMYKGMLLNLIVNNPKASIYCCGVMRCLRKQYVDGVYNEQATVDYFYNTMLPAIKVKNNAIKEIAEYYGCKYIDLEGLTINPWNNSEWSSDTGDLLIHPNVDRGNMMAISIFNQM